jgi:hypothetical protein
VSNHIRGFKRPKYIIHRDITSMGCLPDHCLLTTDDVPQPWKDGTRESARRFLLAQPGT